MKKQKTEAAAEKNLRQPLNFWEKTPVHTTIHKNHLLTEDFR